MSADTQEILLEIAKQLGDDPLARFEELCNSDMIMSEFRRFTGNYSGLDTPSKNIEAVLRGVTNVYDSDIAFLILIDENIKAFRMIAAEFRDGLEDFGNILLNRIISENFFWDIINPGEEHCFTADDLKEEHAKESEWMVENGVNDFMLVPIVARTKLAAFVGTCNIKHLFSDSTMLRLARTMLTLEMRGIMLMSNQILEQNRYSALENNDVVVNMFGGFEVRTFMGTLGLNNIAPNKCCLMLIYLLFNRNRTVSVRELSEVLWPNQLVDNPGTMVKGVAFRLRKLLAPICEKSLILAKQGTYVLNNELILISDIGSFNTVCTQIEEPGLSAADRQKLYERAISLYKGNLLPNFEDEIWLIGQMSHYQIKYWSLVKDYLAFLEKSCQYEKFYSTASHAMNIVYPDGDIYFMMIRVMLEQGRQDLAKNCYLRVEKLFTPEQKQFFLNTWHRLR